VFFFFFLVESTYNFFFFLGILYKVDNLIKEFVVQSVEL